MMFGRSLALAAGVLLLGLAVPACSDGEDASDSQPSTSTVESTTTLPEVAGADFSPEPVQWADCRDVRRFECAVVRVPLDPDSDESPLIDIAVIRQPATGDGDTIGSLFFNPGGPGASGLDFLPQIAPALDPDIAERFDLVSFDPRGVGQSTPVECVDGPTRDSLIAIDPSPDSASELRRAQREVEGFVEACEANAGDRLAFMGTAYVARDLEYLRIALGDKRLNYVGYSYGSAIGQVYAERYPDTIRSMVLDGIQDISLPGSATLGQQYVGFEKSFANWAADCAASPSCAFYNDGAVVPAWEALLAKTESRPLPTGDRDGRVLGPGEFVIATISALYSRSSWDALSEALAQAQAGEDADQLLALSDGYTQRRRDGSYPNIFDINTAVNCADTIAEPDEVWAALEETLKVSAPHFAPGVRYGGRLGCSPWPYRAASMPARPTAVGSPPILLVASTFDPATPYEAAVAIDASLANSVLLTRDGEGHTSFVTSGNACIDDRVNDYLLNLATPDVGTICPSA